MSDTGGGGTGTGERSIAELGCATAAHVTAAGVVDKSHCILSSSHQNSNRMQDGFR